MFRKSFISLLFIAAAIIAGQTMVFAQTSPVSGKVELQKADGSREPVANAVIDVYRTDIKTGSPSGKTNKRGEFNFVGIMLGGTYALSVSAPNCEPAIYPNVKAGQENLVVTLSPGDGRKWTEAEARKAAATEAKAGSSSEKPPELSAADKKAQEEYNKSVEENASARKKAEDTNKVVNTVLKEGAAAFEAKNYDLAIAKFDEGYRADPDFEGSAPIMLTNKGLALRERGITAYRAGFAGTETDKTAGLQKAKEDFAQSLIAFEKSLEILEKAPPGDAAMQAKLTTSKTEALKQYVILQGPMAKLYTDPERSAQAAPILDRYLAAESDDLKKMPLLLNWARDMSESGQSKNAIHAYRILVAKTPDNIDGWAGLGLNLYVEGFSSEPKDDAKLQEGLNYMQKFVDGAPDTHKLKASIKDTIDDLKKSTKLTPQKTAAPKRKT